MTDHHTHEIKNPGKVAVSTGTFAFLGLLVAIGIVSFFILQMTNKNEAWSLFLVNHFFFFSIALGGVFLGAISWISGAMWSSPFRRLGEAFTAYLPISLVTLVIIFFGMHSIYHWTHPEYVKGDVILEGKAGYLNIPFFVIRNLGIFIVLQLFAAKMICNSLKQDQDGDHKWTMKNRFLSPLFLIIFALGYTFMSWDQLMSLDPHWFSTIYGVYCFAGLFYSFLAALCLATIYFTKKGYLKDIINDNHLHDIGKFMFAFTVFWAYIGFSQFMLIWYTNIPEETLYFIKTRFNFESKWFIVSMFLLICKFVVPFIVLLPRDSKRNVKRLTIVAIFMLICHWVDLLWLVQPQFFEHGPQVSLYGIGLTAGFLGLFLMAMLLFLKRHNVVAIGDPRLPEAVFHHHQ